MLACTRLALHKGKEMNEVKRYDAGCEYAGEDEMVEREDGDYVSYSDYAALQQKLDAVLAENVALKNYLQECSVVQGEGNWTSDAEKSVYVPATEWLPPTLATDAQLNAVRAEGIYFAANRLLAAWDSGFIDDTPAQAYDISGAVLSAVEFLPDASHGDFKRDFADSIRAEIAAKPRAETDTTPSQYESLAGGK